MDSGMRFSDIIIHHFVPEVHMEQPPDEDTRCLAQSLARPACPSARFLLGWDVSAGASGIPRGLPISSLVIPGGPRVSRGGPKHRLEKPPLGDPGFSLGSLDLPQAGVFRLWAATGSQLSKPAGAR
jgi:hypothetical protein